MAPETFVGIDVGKQWLDVVVQPEGTHRRLANDESGWAQLLGWLPPTGERLVVLEATGGYEVGVTQALDQAGLAVVVRNPLAMRRFAQSELRFAKNDRVDAAMLAQYAAQRKPHPRPLPDQTGRTIAALLTRRRQLSQMRAAEKARAKQPGLLPVVAAQLTDHITALRRQIAAIDQELAATVATDPARQQRVEQLCTVPGIGVLTATRLVAGLPELGQVSAIKAAALVGVAPYEQQSGRWQGQQAIEGGRRWVRHALFEAMMSIIQWEPTLGAHYAQLRAKGKPHKLAMIACMRRLLGILTMMLRDGLTWQQTDVGQGKFLPDAA